MGAGQMLLLPSMRLRDLLRPVVDVERTCAKCGFVDVVDVVGLVCRRGPHADLVGVNKELTCPKCGDRRADWRTIPQLLRYAAKLGMTVEQRAPLAGRCTGCRCCWDLEVVEVAQRLGPDVTLRSLRDTLPCPRCGRRGWVRVGAAGPIDQGDEQMCGRLAIHSKAELIAERFATGGAVPPIDPRYNAAPLQMLPVIRRNPETGERSLDLLRWGLVPVWSKDATGAARMINARAESVAEKPAFRSAFRKRRCLVPFDNFYEWKATGPKTKQPYAIATTSNEKPDAFAGLWEAWKDPATEEWLKTFTIITTTANEVAAEVHDRMPVILPPSTWGKWLGEEPATEPELLDLLKPYPAEQTRLWPVSRDVGAVKNDRPELVEQLNSD